MLGRAVSCGSPVLEPQLRQLQALLIVGMVKQGAEPHAGCGSVPGDAEPMFKERWSVARSREVELECVGSTLLMLSWERAHSAAAGCNHGLHILFCSAMVFPWRALFSPLQQPER